MYFGGKVKFLIGYHGRESKDAFFKFNNNTGWLFGSHLQLTDECYIEAKYYIIKQNDYKSIYNSTGEMIPQRTLHVGLAFNF